MRSQIKRNYCLMFLLKQIIQIGIISLLLPLNLVSVAATEPLKPIETQKPSFLPDTLIAATENQKRTALVIGNSNYQKAGQLSNPVNDATDMAKALTELGFDVILLKDSNLRQMGEALDEFHAKLRQGGVGVFYYAGHGMQVDGENYLIPIDAKLARKQDTPYESLAVGKILGAMEDAANNVNIIILDACRDNPFSRSWQRSNQSGGLAPVQAVRGSYIAYATAPGDVAADGEGRNGTFTAQILEHIKTPNLSVEEMFKRVRQDVLQETNNKQMPWDSSSLVGEFSFNQTSTPVATFTPAPDSTTLPKESTEDLAQQENNQGTIDKYTQAIALNSNSAVVYNNRGSAYLRLQQYQDALDDYNKAVELDPNLAQTYNGRGTAYLNLKQYQNAIADYDKAIKLNPDLALAYHGRASAYLSLQQYQDALGDYNKAIELDPNLAQAYNGRGTTYLNLKQYQNAIADYDKAIELNSDYALVYNNRGSAYFNLKQYQNAIADYNRAIELNPDLVLAYYGRASVYLGLQQYQEALGDYNKAIELDPNLAQAYNGRGTTYLKLKQYQNAIDDFNKVTQIFCQQGNSDDCQKAQEVLRLMQTESQ
jgi:tetratricopeptide (TPR) repeat protein